MQTAVSYHDGRFGEISAGSVARFIFSIFIALAAVTVGHLAFLCLILFLTVLALLAWGGSFGDLIKVARYVVWLALIVFIVHLFTGTGHEIFKIWFVKATSDGARAGVVYSAKLVIFAYAAYIIFIAVDPFELISPLERLARLLGNAGRLLSSFALAFFLAMRFLPELSEQARMTLLAFKSKGLDLKGGLRHKAEVGSLMLAPLFVSAFKRAEVAAGALNVKGYATRYKRAVFAPWRITLGDLITILAGIIIFISGLRTG